MKLEGENARCLVRTQLRSNRAILCILAAPLPLQTKVLSVVYLGWDFSQLCVFYWTSSHLNTPQSSAKVLSCEYIEQLNHQKRMGKGKFPCQPLTLCTHTNWNTHVQWNVPTSSHSNTPTDSPTYILKVMQFKHTHIPHSNVHTCIKLIHTFMLTVSNINILKHANIHTHPPTIVWLFLLPQIFILRPKP